MIKENGICEDTKIDILLNVFFVSGASPRVFAMLKDDKLSPYEFMLSVIGNERYAKIVA